MFKVQKITALDAVTANATSNLIYVGGFNKVGIRLRRADHTSGSSAFTVQGGLGNADETPTMAALNTLIDNVTNTNAQTLTRVAGKTLSVNGDAMLWVSPETPVTHIRVVVVETTDGTHSADVFGFC